jgi:hypothetical protein
VKATRGEFRGALVKVGCDACWAAGNHGVLLANPGRSLPAVVWCPTCGARRVLQRDHILVPNKGKPCKVH